MDDCAEHQHEDERNVQDMPEREQALIGPKLRNLLQFSEVSLQYAPGDPDSMNLFPRLPVALNGGPRENAPHLPHARPVHPTHPHGDGDQPPDAEKPPLIRGISLESLEALLGPRREMELRFERFAR